MKKNRIVIGIIVLLILSIGGIAVGKIIYDRSVEAQRSAALAEEQRLEEERKSNYVDFLIKLGVYNETKDDYIQLLRDLGILSETVDEESYTGHFARKEIHGFYVAEDHLKVYLHLYHLISPPKDPLTIEKFYDQYLEPDLVVEEKINRFKKYISSRGTIDDLCFWEEIANAYTAYEKENKEKFNNKEWRDLTYEDIIAIEEWAVVHPNEELYPKLSLWHAETEEKEKGS